MRAEGRRARDEGRGSNVDERSRTWLELRRGGNQSGRSSSGRTFMAGSMVGFMVGFMVDFMVSKLVFVRAVKKSGGPDRGRVLENRTPHPASSAAAGRGKAPSIQY